MTCRCGNREAWRVHMRWANMSAFNGYRWTPSDYSEVHCELKLGGCGAVWRTKAAYVSGLPSGGWQAREDEPVLADAERRKVERQLRRPRRRAVCAKCGEPGGPDPGSSLGPGTEPGTLLHHKCGAVLR